MKKIVLTSILTMISSIVFTQSFEKFGSGLKYKTFYHQQNINYHLCTIDSVGKIYNVKYDNVSSNFDFGKEKSEVRLSIFDGISWLNTLPIQLYSKNSIDAPRILDIKYYRGEIYICGSFDSSEMDLGAGIVKWSDGEWKSVGIELKQRFPDYFEVNKIFLYGLGNQEKMIITGNFDSITNERVNGIMSYSNGLWNSVGKGVLKGFQNLSGTSNVFFHPTKDSLYIFNKNKIKPDSIEIGGKTIKKLGVLRQNQIEEISTPSLNIAALSEYKLQLVIIPSSDLFYINSVTIKVGNSFINHIFSDLDSFYTTNYISSFEFNNKLYLFFQKPNIGIKVYVLDDNSLNFYTQFKISDNYIQTEFNSSKDRIVISGNFKKIVKGEYTDSFNQIFGIDLNAKSIVNVLSYWDQNSDKIKQSTEPLIHTGIVYTSDQQTLISNGEGIANFFFPIGTNTVIQAKTSRGFISNETYQLVNSVDSIYKVEIPFQAAQTDDVKVSLNCGTGLKAKQGFTTQYSLDISNNSNEDKTVQLTVNFEQKTDQMYLKGFQADQMFPNGFTYTMNIAKHQNLNKQFSIRYPVDSFNLGQLVKCKVSFTSIDDNLSNNQDSLIQTVVAAYDPNEKVAIPGEIVSKNTEIKYVIYFENLGNDTALNVTVVDTFQSLLDITEVILGGCSHGNYDIEIKNQTIIWQFNNIRLPPRKQDSINSNGFVSFRSKLSNMAKVGDTIKNKAAIFFDYQKPVITNEASVRIKNKDEIIDIEEKGGFLVYPNPSSGKIWVQVENTNTIQLYNLVGQVIYETQINPNIEIEIPGHIANGIYFIRMGELTAMVVISR